MERWRVLDCLQLDGSITAERGAISIQRSETEKVSVPVADVAVVLIGLSVRISTGAVHRLLADDVAVLFCDWRGVPYGGAYSWRTHSRVGARQRAQAKLSEPRRKNAWGRIVSAKLAGQAAVLRDTHSPNSGELFSMAKAVRSGDPENLEAQGARIYWQSLWGDDGFHRLPGADPGNAHPLNGALDYAYTVLRGFGIRSVLGAGLAPTLGLFHHGRMNSFALVDDLIEPFRPAIDQTVAELPRDATLNDREVKQHLVAACSQKFLQDGTTIPTVFSDFAQSFGKYVEGDTARLEVPVWAGVDDGR